MGIITVMKLGSMTQAEGELLSVRPHKYKGSKTPILWDNNGFLRVTDLVLAFLLCIICLVWNVWKDLIRKYVTFMLLFKEIKNNSQEQGNISKLFCVVVLWYILSFACHSHISFNESLVQRRMAVLQEWTHCFSHHCAFALMFCPPLASKIQGKINLEIHD